MSEADAFLARVEALGARMGIAPIEAALVAAVGEGIVRDTVGFGRVFGVGHALALRAAAALEGGLLRVVGRSERSRRLRLELTEKGASLFGECAVA